MEKYYSKLRFPLWYIVVLLVLNSCSSESAYIKNESNGTEEIAKLAPFNIKVNGNKATVGFVQTPVPFEFDLTVNNHHSDIQLIKDAIGKDIPLRIFVYSQTNKIAKVFPVTEQEILDYRKNLVKADDEILNRPDPSLLSIFPDEATLMNVYTIITNNSCVSTNFQDGCLTFQYATDGCNARAHKMKQLLNANGYNCQKHYIFGDLLASSGTCCTPWVYHTAPLVLVRINSEVVEERVLDPSLFTMPVTPEVWRAACQNMICVFNPEFEFAPATYKTVPGIVFNFNPSSMSFSLDSDYFKTDCTLDVYHNESGCGLPGTFPPENCQN